MVERAAELWSLMLNSTDRRATMQTVAWRREPWTMRDDEAGLGPALRLLVLRELLGEGLTAGEFWSELRERNNEHGKPLPSADVEKVFNPNSPVFPRDIMTSSAGEVFARWLDARMPEAGPRDGAAIFQRRFDGADAVQEYARWLRYGDDVIIDDGFGDLDDLGRPPRRQFLIDDNRRHRHDAFRDAIFNSEPGAPQFINVHQRSMWNGLTAATIHALTESGPKRDDRPILYVPLMSKGPRYRAPSFLQVLGYLKAFFERRDVRSAKPISSNDDIHAILLEVRKRMAVAPAIIVFDGYANTPLTCGDLERAILDDHMVTLLRRLLSPPITGMEDPAQLRAFGRNRIVLVSDLRITDVVPGLDFEMPQPARTKMAEVVKLQELGHEKEVLAIIGRMAVLQDARSESVVHALDALVSAYDHVKPKFAGHRLVDHLCRDIQQVLDRDVLLTDVRQINSVVEPLLHLFERERPEWFWILRFIASTPGGLRRDTLLRLIEASKDLTGADGRPVEVLPNITEPEISIDRLLRVCQSILTDKMSDEFEGLDAAHPAEFISGISTNRWSKEPGGMPTIDFRIPEVRQAVLREVRQKDFRRIQHLHLLLAEEAISQQTIALRHNPNLSSSRSLRRLMSVIYHGYMSLPMTNSRTFGQGDIRGPDFTIPFDPEAGWRWIHLFAFRRMTEQPPSFQLSRYYGLDNLKLEILKVSARPWLTWQRYPRIEKPANSRGSLLPDPRSELAADAPPPKERERKIAIDYFLSKAQVEYALGEVTASATSLDIAEAYDRSELSRLRVAKRRLDLYLLEQDFESARKEEQAVTSLLSTAWTQVDAYIVEMTANMKRLVSPENFGPSPTLISSGPVIDALRGDLEKWGNGGLSQVSDLLFRIGERHAVAGDHNYSDQRVKEIKSDHVRKNISGYSSAIDDFCTSISYFRLAEKIRLAVFADEPTGSHFFASGHSARQMTRVALKLENLSRRASPENHSTNGYFAKSARRMADVITRHLYRYPRERASMLIMEATMARQADFSPSGTDGLRSARRFLEDAEPLVSSLNSNTRVRMRFLLERTKIHRRLGERSKDDKRAMYFALCDLDLTTLESLAETQPSMLWRNLVSIQRESVRRLRG